MSGLRRLLKRVLPDRAVAWLKRAAPHAHPRPVGWVDLGQLRRGSPISRGFGLGRGKPLDRYYIETFLQ
jgi:hypothetical protein